MDEEQVDIRPYIQKIAYNWYWIAVTAVFFSTVVFIGFTASSSKYEANALITFTDPQTDVLTSLTDQLVSPQLVTISKQDELARVYPELAKSDELLDNLLDRLIDHPANDIHSLSSLKNISFVELNDNLLTFQIVHEDPEFATEAVNSWASLFVDWINEVYTSQYERDVEFYIGQIDETSEQLEKVEEQLVEFQPQNRAVIIQNQIEALNDFQVSLLNEKNDLPFLITEANRLYDRLENSAGNVPSDVSSELLTLLLQLRFIEEKTNTPLQIQFAINEPGSNLPSADQISLIEDLISALSARQIVVEEQLADVENQILTLQQSKQVMDIEFDRLIRKRDTLTESLIALNRKLEETQTSTQNIRGGVRLASRAMTPDKPTNSQKIPFTIIAGIFGIASAIGFLFIREWWNLYLTS